MKSRFALLVVLFALALSGCSTIASRIKEKADVFAALDPRTQELIRKGGVEVGYTMDMVYMALGVPDERSEKITKQGTRTTWIYTDTYEEYAGTAHVGYRRRYYRDPRTGYTAVYLDPVYSDVYRERTEEKIRIIFNNGKVSAIEQTK